MKVVVHVICGANESYSDHWSLLVVLNRNIQGRYGYWQVFYFIYTA
jgi:hypothetical protein